MVAYLLTIQHITEVYSCERAINAGREHRRNIMAEPIRLGLVLEGEDACNFDERMRNPNVTKERVAFFREAIKVYNTHKF